MRTVVIGAGVVGITTAYALARKGYSVTVVERQPSTAMESSFANGGQLSFGFASPMASPQLLRKAPSILLGKDSAFVVPPRFIVRKPLWLVNFVRACSSKAHAEYARQLSLMAAESKRALDKICAETGVNFSRRKAGKLVIYSSESSLDAARKEFRHRTDAVTLDRADCVALDPALDSVGSNFCGGVFFEDDEVGDIERFCDQLATKCKDLYSSKFMFNVNVDSIEKQSDGNLTLKLSNGDSQSCNAVVVCTGAAGVNLLQQHNIKLPIVPVEGYSITAPLGESPPHVAITDADHKIVCSRIGDYVRIAGFADFGHRSAEQRHNRIQSLIRVSRERFPKAANFSHLRSTWSGLRPATPSSLPIVGKTRVPGVYVNMGHGMYGWTLAPATANHLATALSSESTSLVSAYPKEIT